MRQPRSLRSSRRRTLPTASVLILGAFFSAHAAFEQDMPNLRVPTNLKPFQLMVDIEHRFLPGFSAANVDLGLRYLVWSKLEVSGFYTMYMYSPLDNARNEYGFGVSYAVPWPGVVRAEPMVQFFSYAKGLPARRQNLFLAVALETEPILKTFKPVVNVAYDAYNLGLGLGAGLNAGFKLAIGPIRRFDVAGEYYPRLYRAPGFTGNHDSFSLALTLETYGHHFMFVFGNNLASGARRLMLGAPDNKLSFGFNIHRFLDLKDF